MTDDTGRSSLDESSSASAFSSSSPRVMAILVAYNSAVAVERCLRSLNAQDRSVDCVLIIDNSEPRSLDIDELDVAIVARTRIIRTGANLGPAGGFALGLATFMEDGGYTHAWLMDDDCYPEPPALAALLETGAQIRAGAAIFPSSGGTQDYPAWAGVLIDRLAVRLGGLPRPDLFWWAEDTEYLQYRLPRSGVAILHVPEARVPSDHLRRAGGRASWKYYYEVRNMIWYRVEVQRGSSLHKLPRSLVKLFGAALLSENRFDNLRLYAKGFAHGWVGRLGVQVRPPVPRSD